MHYTLLAAAIALAVSAPLVAPGCASAPVAEGVVVADAPPSDFTLAFTVLNPTTRRNIWTLPRDQRPSRFVMEADWVLRAFSGLSLADESFPRETRQLDHAQVQAIWNDLRTSGLLDPAHPAIIGAPPALADVKDPMWAVTIMADGDRRILILGPDDYPPARPVLDRLSDLAWLPK